MDSEQSVSTRGFLSLLSPWVLWIADMKNQLEELGVEFAALRGQAEIDLARALICEPQSGIGVTESVGLGPEHFVIHLDMRIVFCACEIARNYGRERVVSLVDRALRADNYEVDLGRFSEPWKGSNDFVRLFFIRYESQRLIDLHRTERDAQEHIAHARKLIAQKVYPKAQVAA